MQHPFGDEMFFNWLNKQEPTARYDYFDNRNCLICKYFKSLGFDDVWVDAATFRLGDGTKLRALPEGWNEIAQAGEVAFTQFRSFGNAQKIAAELIAA